MKFPNAAKGVKRIFTAEILELISTICMVVAVVLLILGLVAGNKDTDSGLAVAGGSWMIALIFMLAWVVLSVIAFIMNLVGIINASHDESNFKSALFFLIVSIVSVILSSVFVNTNSMASSLLYSLYSLMNVFVTIFVIAGGVKLADKLNRGDISTKGTNVLKLIIVVNILSLISMLVSTFMGGMMVSVTAAVLSLVALVLNIVQYFMYLSFLSKAKKMLAK